MRGEEKVAAGLLNSLADRDRTRSFGSALGLLFGSEAEAAPLEGVHSFRERPNGLCQRRHVHATSL